MIVKTTFKSHFKIRRISTKNKDKKIFVKNIFIFLLFSKIFVKNCIVSFLLKKHTTNKTNILKAPSRHKKFFHQVFCEYFQINLFLKFNNFTFKNCNNIVIVFKKFNKMFQKLGSNTLNRTKISISFFFLKTYFM